ncbi:MAG: NADH-quinone oxidoreductase subunit NuoK [Candidatus Marinimicrobia bacterium]|nr:NADH-quinone oxidoreductase subunit NuoK [Candidatus Neomarinimicrobiota bacterium]
MVVPLYHIVTLAGLLFTIGMLGVLFRRNAIIVFMSVEIMLNAVNLVFIAFARYHGSVDGQVFVFFIMTLAAAEVAVGLAIMISLFRNLQTTDISSFNLMKN